jgi:uncharacterized protein (DUF305 family)
VRRVLLATLFGMVISVLTACGMSGGDSAQADSTASQADIQFSQQMIPHHQQSIQLAGLATQRGLSDFVKSMAGEITTKETAELDLMSGWLKSWNAEMPAGHGGHDRSGMMLPETEISALESAAGNDFDRMWLTAIAKHLGNGVQMAKTVLNSGTHAGTKTLAQQIVTGQEAEIAEINERLPGYVS